MGMEQVLRAERPTEMRTEPFHRRLVRRLALVAGCALVIGACGGSDGRPEYTAEQYLEAIRAEVPDDIEMHCLAPTMIDSFGPDRLSLAGVTPTDFATAESL